MEQMRYDFRIEKLCSIETKKINFPFLIQLLKYCKEVDNPNVLSITPFKKEMIARNLDWSIKTHANRFSQELQKLRKQNIIVISKNSHNYGSTTYEFNSEFIDLQTVQQKEDKTANRDTEESIKQKVLSYIGEIVVENWLEGRLNTINIEGFNFAIKKFRRYREIKDCKGSSRPIAGIYEEINKFKRK